MSHYSQDEEAMKDVLTATVMSLCSFAPTVGKIQVAQSIQKAQQDDLLVNIIEQLVQRVQNAECVNNLSMQF
jgi:predicted kinase